MLYYSILYYTITYYNIVQYTHAVMYTSYLIITTLTTRRRGVRFEFELGSS